jgi:hypothetical protein
MISNTISKISEEINQKVFSAEKGLSDECFNPFVTKLYEEIIDPAIDEDLSEQVQERIIKLSRMDIPMSQIAKLLKDSSVPKFVSLNVVPNEIASVVVGQIEIGLPIDTVRRVKMLSLTQYLELKKAVKAKLGKQDSEFILLDCRFDRWVLVVDEEKFNEKTLLLLQGSIEEI